MKIVNAASACATRYSTSYNQACGISAEKTFLSSRAPAFIPSSGRKISTCGWLLSITPTYLVEQLSPPRGTEYAAPNGVMHSSLRDTVKTKNLKSEQLLGRSTTIRGRQFGPNAELLAALDVPSRMPSRTPSPDPSLYCHTSKDTRANQIPVKHTFIHYDCRSSDDDMDDDCSFDAETHSSTSLTKSASSPSILMHNRLFEPTCETEEDKESQKLVEDSTKLETQRPSHEMKLAHASGTCKPCAYFYEKEDGCRQGADCNFCHLCPPNALKDYRRQKARSRRREQARRQHAARGYYVSEQMCQHQDDLNSVLNGLLPPCTTLLVW